MPWQGRAHAFPGTESRQMQDVSRGVRAYAARGADRSGEGRAERYLALLAYEGLKLDALIDTHTHADHPTGTFLLKDLTDARLIMHRRAPVPVATEHVEDGDTIHVGDLSLEVLYTPGHTPDSISLYAGDRVFTGDVLLIGGTGRADFAGGDAGQQYDAITRKLFDVTRRDASSIPRTTTGVTRAPRSARRNGRTRASPGRTRDEYVALMAKPRFPAARQDPGSASAEPERDRRRQGEVPRSHAVESRPAVFRR